MENEYIIPANYTDAGKLLGAFEIRSAAEAVLLCVPLALILLKLSPFGLTGTVVLVQQTEHVQRHPCIVGHVNV